jgi:tetratricopeptide (TPR) repeat protein
VSNLPKFLLQEAIALHQAGAVDQAAARYQSIINREPRNIDALFLLGVACFERKLFEEAADLLKKAVRIAPAHAAGHNLYGRTLIELGRTEEALKEFHRAFTAQPDLVDAYRNRAALLATLGRYEDAITTLDRALSAVPRSAELLNERGLALVAAGHHADAIECYDKAIAINPQIAILYANRGNAFAELKRHEDSVENFARAVALQPDFVDAQINLGNMLRKLLRFEEAIEHYDLAIASQPGLGLAYISRGMAQLELDRYADAKGSFDRALAAEPALAETEYAANILSSRAWANVGLDRHADALVDVAQADRIANGNGEVLLRTGHVQLLLGHWKEGLPKYEHRLDRVSAVAPELRQLPIPRWAGEARQNLILVTEQGLGDAINFACCIPELARKGFQITVLTRPVLAPLLASVAGVTRVATSTAELVGLPDACWLPLISVPNLLGMTVETVPARTPYLTIDAAAVSAWKTRLGTAGFKIGIGWQGNPTQGNDHGRSMPLAEFAALARLPDARLISLQKRPGSEQIGTASFRDRIETPLDENDLSAEALLDTAALIMNLDLVVTSDSMLAHLTGALNRPGYVALRKIPDWRWLVDRNDTPWYPSLRLFRQQNAGDWFQVFEAIEQAVLARLRGGTAAR